MVRVVANATRATSFRLARIGFVLLSERDFVFIFQTNIHKELSLSLSLTRARARSYTFDESEVIESGREQSNETD